MRMSIPEVHTVEDLDTLEKFALQKKMPAETRGQYAKAALAAEELGLYGRALAYLFLSGKSDRIIEILLDNPDNMKHVYEEAFGHVKRLDGGEEGFAGRSFDRKYGFIAKRTAQETERARSRPIN